MSKDGFMVPEGVDASRSGYTANPRVAEIEASDTGFKDIEGNDEKTSAPRQRVRLSEISVLLMPAGGVVAPELGLKIVVVDDLAQLGVQVVAADDNVVIIQITSTKVLKAFVENVDLFNTSAATLVHVPSGDYDAYFEQATWQLRKVSYDTLTGELAAARESNAAVKKVKMLDDHSKKGYERKRQTPVEEKPSEFTFSRSTRNADQEDDEA